MRGPLGLSARFFISLVNVRGEDGSEGGLCRVCYYIVMNEDDIKCIASKRKRKAVARPTKKQDSKRGQ
jgi:hypothetical protein